MKNHWSALLAASVWLGTMSPVFAQNAAPIVVPHSDANAAVAAPLVIAQAPVLLPVEPRCEWLLESGFQFAGVAVNNRPNYFASGAQDTQGSRRGAFEFLWTPRIAWKMRSGFLLGAYGTLGVMSKTSAQRIYPSQKAAGQLLAGHTGTALTGGGGLFIGLRHYLPSGKYLQVTGGAAYLQHHFSHKNTTFPLNEKTPDQRIDIDLRYDFGFPIHPQLYASVGPFVRLSAHRITGDSIKQEGIQEVAAGAVFSVSGAFGKKKRMI